MTSAIDKLKEFEDRIQQLKSNLESLALDGERALACRWLIVRLDNADGVDGDEKQDADLQYQQDLSVVDHRYSTAISITHFLFINPFVVAALCS